MILMGLIFFMAMFLITIMLVNIESNLTYKMRLKQEDKVKDLIENYEKNNTAQSLDSAEREIKYELSKLEIDINQIMFESLHSSNQLKITTWNKNSSLFNKPHIDERVYTIELNKLPAIPNE